MKYTWPTPAFCVGTQRNLYSTDWRRGLVLGLTQILGLASGVWRRGFGVGGLASGVWRRGFGVGGLASGVWRRGFGVGGLASGVWRRGFGVGGLASGVWRRGFGIGGLASGNANFHILDTNMLVSPTQNSGVGGIAQRQPLTPCILRSG